MLKIRRSEERGHLNFGWLDTHHSFSFGDYFDPDAMGFRALRVINEDRVAAGAGFPMHPHRDMEIVTYVIQGALAHKDTLGNSAIIRPGEVQHMSAGTGIRHSEFNPSETEPCHLLQIWITPDREGYSPRYGQETFATELNKNSLVQVAGSDGAPGLLNLHQDVRISVGKLRPDENIEVRLGAGRHAWIQIVAGELQVNDLTVMTGDGLAVSDERLLKMKSISECEFLVFDLP